MQQAEERAKSAEDGVHGAGRWEKSRKHGHIWSIDKAISLFLANHHKFSYIYIYIFFLELPAQKKETQNRKRSFINTKPEDNNKTSFS